MKKIAIGIVIILVVLVAAAIIVPNLIPLDTYKRLVSTQVKQATGRDLDIRGVVSMSLFPWVALELNNVAFSNLPGSKEKDMARLSRLDLNLKVLPLLSGNVEIGKFILQDPTVFLEVDKNGRSNWEFQTSTGTANTKPAAKTKADNSGISLPVSDIRLGDVGIRNGSISYSDAKSGKSQKISNINMTVSLSSLASPFSAKGEAIWNKKKVSLEADAASLRDILEGKATKVSAKVISDPVNLDFAGTVRLQPSADVAGQWAVRVPSVRNLSAWIGNPMETKGEGFGLFDIKGQITARPDFLELKNVDLQFDEIKGKANTRVKLAKARPSIEGTLELERLNLNPYLPKEKSAQPMDKSVQVPASKPAPKSQSDAPGPTWSTEEIDFSPLKTVDADLSFQSKEIIYDKIKIGSSAVSLKLNNGKLNLNLTRLDLYKGSGVMKLTLDSNSTPPAITKEVKLSGIDAQPFLKDAADLGFLSGKANSTVSVRAHGKSQMEMVKSLNGNLSIQFLDGAIEGVNLGAMFRNVKSAFLDPKAGEARKTDFSELTSTFKIQNGIMRTQDLQMKSPLLRLGGKGEISLPPKTMNMRLEPKVALTSKGQGGEKEVGGITVPVIVKGPWANLSYRPDLEGMIKNLPKDPEKVKGLIEGVIKDKEKKGGLPGALKGLFR